MECSFDTTFQFAKCDKCMQRYQLTSSLACIPVSECIVNSTTCASCIPNCQTCRLYNYSTLYCYECKSGYQLSMDQKGGSTQQQCFSSINEQTKYFPTIKFCTEGFYYNPEKAVCYACPAECKECSSQSECLSCLNSVEYYYNIKTRRCIKKICDLSQYFHATTGCTNCSAYCESCYYDGQEQICMKKRTSTPCGQNGTYNSTNQTCQYSESCVIDQIQFGVLLNLTGAL